MRVLILGVECLFVLSSTYVMLNVVKASREKSGGQRDTSLIKTVIKFLNDSQLKNLNSGRHSYL